MISHRFKEALDSKKSTGLLVKSGDALFVPQIPYSVSVSEKYSFQHLTFMKIT